MKKLFALLTITGFLSFGMLNTVYAQDETATEEVVAEGEEVMEEAPAEEVVEEAAPVEEPAAMEEEVAPAADESFTQIIKQKFIEGGPGFMGLY